MAQPRHSFDWVEHTPGRWQRDIDEVETFWAKAAKVFDTQGRRPFAITGHVSLKIDTAAAASRPDVNGALRKAWCRIRQDHPSIASQVEYDFDTERFTRTYSTIQSEVEREGWLEATFLEISNGQLGVEFANSDPAAPDLPTIFVITLPSDDKDFEYRDIIFRAPHDTIDGIGTLLLLSNIVKHASDALERGSSFTLPGLDGTEVQNLSPPYRAAAAVPQDLNSVQKARVDKMFSEHAFFSQPHEPKQYLSLPFREGAQVPGRHQRTEITLDQAKTAKILAACRAIGATVTHAFNVAIPIVLRDLKNENTHQQPLHYRCDLLRNLRPFCAEPFSTSKHPVTAYHAGSSFGFEIEMPVGTDGQPLKEEFQRVLQEVRAFYRRVADDDEHSYLAPHIWAGWLQTLPRLIKNPAPGPPPSPNPGVSLSSLGRLDDILPSTMGHFSISKPWITGEEMGNGYGIFLASHRGELSLAAAYNDAWQAEGDAQKFLQACIQVLCESLDINI
ncbi:hypothetical protein FALCPG4_008744 [Fusarium falciforme]